MRKSEHYLASMQAVIEANFLTTGQKIEVLETLMDDQKLELWKEKEAEK